METEQLEERIHNLLTDKNFLTLTSLQKKSNLFDKLAASHLEMWHSAFIKWMIDPKSDFGLGTFPLKRFIYTVIRKGKINDEKSKSNLKISDIENEELNLENINFETELNIPNVGRLDISGAHDISEENGKKAPLRIIIENKVKSREGIDQTQRYYDYSLENNEDYEHTLLIFLSPDKQGPKSDKFYHINYQDICDYVIKPCLSHPEIKNESRFLLEQYLYNLKKPVKGKNPMANPNKEICESIYKTHYDVLEEIFNSVKGEVPQIKNPREKLTAGYLTLTNLFEQKFLNLNDILIGHYDKEVYQATFEKNINNKIIIKFSDGGTFSSPSSAAKYITNYNMNGWTFWEVEGKGTLEELRDKLASNISTKEDLPEVE